MLKRCLLAAVLAFGVVTGAGALSIGAGLTFEASGDEVRFSQVGLGAGLFFDLTFVELTAGIMTGNLTFTVLGKLPFFLGWGDVFPLLGVGYNMVFIGDDRDWALHTPRIMFGAGVDVDLTRAIFVRASVLGSYRFPPSWRYSRGGFGVTINAGMGFRL